MGATSYERLSSPAAGGGRRGGGRRGGGGGGLGAWAALRRGLARLCAARRGRWAPARGMLVRARGRSWRGRRVAAGCGYDSEGYARNFDDGLWKAEEGAPWRAAGPAIGACRLARAVSSVQ